MFYLVSNVYVVYTMLGMNLFNLVLSFTSLRYYS